jgi:transcriptional adapter 3
MRINNTRKKRLLETAKVRIAYYEYESIKEGMENNIAAAFSRIGRSGAIKNPKKNKKTKDRIASSLVVDPGNGGPAGISGLGIFAMDGTVEVPDDIKEMLHSLEMWKEHVGKAFEQKQLEQPGLVWGLPPTSIYDGLDKDIESAELEEDREKQKVHAQLVPSHSPSFGGIVPSLHANIAPGGHLTNGGAMVFD